MKGDQHVKLHFIWNPLPNMIIYDDVLSLTNLNCKTWLSIAVQKDKINDLIWLFNCKHMWEHEIKPRTSVHGRSACRNMFVGFGGRITLDLQSRACSLVWSFHQIQLMCSAKPIYHSHVLGLVSMAVCRLGCIMSIMQVIDLLRFEWFVTGLVENGPSCK